MEQKFESPEAREQARRMREEGQLVIDNESWLRRNAAGGKAPKQIVFKGEPFDALSVRRWRDRLLGAKY